MTQPVAALSIAEGLAALAAEDPDRPAVTCSRQTITRGELEARTNRLARAYLELGVTPDSFVTIGLPNGIEFIEATIATWKAGATPQPVSDRLPTPERRAIIDLAEPSLVVGIDTAEAGGRPSIPGGFEPDPEHGDAPLEPRFAKALKAPTSGGSTGRPKLIVSGHRATVPNVTINAGYTRMPNDGVHLATGPMYHNGPFIYAFAALFTGNHVVVMPRFDAEEALALVEQHRVDWMYLVPTMMQRIWRLPEVSRLGHDLSSLNGVFHVAAPCPQWLKQAWIDWLGPSVILELYGGTEGQVATFIDGTEWLRHRGSVGRPLSGEIQIRDPDGHRSASGEIGTVWIRQDAGTQKTYRYIGAEARRAGDGWETLGDVGWMDADGYLYLTDRDTDMILVGGSNVYPAEIEAVLTEHPAVADACVIGLPDDDLGNVPHAIVTLSSPVDDADLDAYLRERLASYKRPRSFERVTGHLRDDAGKVRRPALRADRLSRPPRG
ncbi:MAG TPA: AMP-binding protein [Acidimicrobiales bacterium]|nr:AMP-binding protein [Acidimicrobiales bacterium]